MAGEITTIARPYAEAVFERAQETGLVDAWSQALTLLCAVASDPQMVEQIANPNVPRERIRDMILQICGAELPATRQPIWSGSWPTTPGLPLSQRSPCSSRPARVADQGVRHVVVRSAFPVDADQERELAESLARRLGAQIELTVEEDPELIGGVEIHAGDLVIDDSVRGKLKQLAHALQF